jgi:hypothetical protein
VDELECDFCTFKAAVHSEGTLSDKLHNHGASIGFEETWKTVVIRYYKLRQFCGGLATKCLFEGASFSPDRLHNRPEAARYLLTLVTACSDQDTHTLSKFS